MSGGKIERAKIRVEHIISHSGGHGGARDVLLARFGLIPQMKTLDDGLAEAISSLIWVAPRMQVKQMTDYLETIIIVLQADVQEL